VRAVVLTAQARIAYHARRVGCITISCAIHTHEVSIVIVITLDEGRARRLKTHNRDVAKTDEPFDRPRQKGGFPKRSASHYQRRVASVIHVSESNKAAPPDAPDEAARRGQGMHGGQT
jgi:hypothetical protein